MQITFADAATRACTHPSLDPERLRLLAKSDSLQQSLRYPEAGPALLEVHDPLDKRRLARWCATAALTAAAYVAWLYSLDHV